MVVVIILISLSVGAVSLLTYMVMEPKIKEWKEYMHNRDRESFLQNMDKLDYPEAEELLSQYSGNKKQLRRVNKRLQQSIKTYNL